MTVFVGSFEHPDVFHRACTVIATVSIVVTAVYILRVVGKILYGTCRNPGHLKLTDATWDERFCRHLPDCVCGRTGTCPVVGERHRQFQCRAYCFTF